MILIATGSEPSLAAEAHHQQTQESRDGLPPCVKARMAVEQAFTLGWERYVGESGRVICMHAFGAPAPLKELRRKRGFEPERVAAAKELLRRA